MTHPTHAQLRAELARELYEERAAILEYMAGYTRAEAERLARLAHPDPDARGKQAEFFRPQHRQQRIP